MASGSRPLGSPANSDVVDVHDIVDAVVLQNDLLPRDQQLRAGRMLLKCARHGAVPSVQTQTDDTLNRRGRAWLGHPRAGAHSLTVSVDAGHKAGQNAAR